MIHASNFYKRHTKQGSQPTKTRPLTEDGSPITVTPFAGDVSLVLWTDTHKLAVRGIPTDVARDLARQLIKGAKAADESHAKVAATRLADTIKYHHTKLDLYSDQYDLSQS